MNRLLVHYCVDVQHPEVSGAEHLEMLQIRDRLAELEPTLTAEEQEALVGADRVLVERAVAFHQGPYGFWTLRNTAGNMAFHPRAGGGISTL